MDKIIFEKIQFYAYHGVYEEEKKLGQKFEVDLELYLDLKDAGVNDDLEKTVNYAFVYEVVNRLVTETNKKLLEAVAEGVADELLQQFPIKGVMVRVKKLQPPIPGYLQSVSVEIRRGAFFNG